jgi:hypothetical protein
MIHYVIVCFRRQIVIIAINEELGFAFVRIVYHRKIHSIQRLGYLVEWRSYHSIDNIFDNCWWISLSIESWQELIYPKV